MRKIALVVLAIVFCAVLANDAFAVQTKGKIVSIDMSGPTVVVKEDSGATLPLSITGRTDIQKGMRDMDLAEFKPGVLVVVRYKVEGGKNIAKYIGYVSGELQRFAPKGSKR
ncbi:MAG: hypothetical protein ABIH01_03230 [Candidatus Omnitrophota bacterium]